MAVGSAGGLATTFGADFTGADWAKAGSDKDVTTSAAAMGTPAKVLTGSRTVMIGN